MKADIWSLGVVYYQLLYGKYPFMGANDDAVLIKIMTTKPDFKSINISANVKDFIERCLTIDPKQRISWSEIYDHPLIKS
jgi:serine/threonine protein kinase